MLIATVMLLQAAAAPVDPIAPAWQGRVQCHNPDRDQKTCQSIGSYTRASDGRIQNTAVVLLNPQPAIVMTSMAPVEIKAGLSVGRSVRPMWAPSPSTAPRRRRM